MKKQLLAGLAAGVFVFGMAGMAHALSFTFSDKDFLGGASWGTMDFVASGANTLQVTYTAANSIPAASEATGFAFGFYNVAGVKVQPISIANPANAAFVGDRDDLNWISYAKAMGTLPGIANADEFLPPVQGSDFTYAATEGNTNNFTPPGIKPGQYDIFSLTFAQALPGSLEEFVKYTGVRLQSLPDDINGGSLFLAGGGDNPVPEPATMLLFGTGLAGIVGRRLRKKKS